MLTVDADGQPSDRQPKQLPYWQEFLAEGVVLELVAIPGGKFLMGAPRTEEGWQPNQSPQHWVAIAPFWMGTSVVTQAQWQAVAALPKVKQPLVPDPACFIAPQRPVEQISWQDAMEFCARLSALTGREYRLPSEAEWEYACRAGTQTPFHFGETISTDIANYSGLDWEFDGKLCTKGAYGKGKTGCDRRETTPVKNFGVANAFGLYDMHGNVREWCADAWYDYQQAPDDGSAWNPDTQATHRILRGGSWNGGPRSCRAAFRSRFDAISGMYDIGFRVLCCQVEPGLAVQTPVD